jgi:hypothetical protein
MVRGLTEATDCDKREAPPKWGYRAKQRGRETASEPANNRQRGLQAIHPPNATTTTLRCTRVEIRLPMAVAGNLTETRGFSEQDFEFALSTSPAICFAASAVRFWAV